jgi:hypothetical protein
MAAFATRYFSQRLVPMDLLTSLVIMAAIRAGRVWLVDSTNVPAWIRPINSDTRFSAVRFVGLSLCHFWRHLPLAV